MSCDQKGRKFFDILLACFYVFSSCYGQGVGRMFFSYPTYFVHRAWDPQGRVEEKGERLILRGSWWKEAGQGLAGVRGSMEASDG